MGRWEIDSKVSLRSGSQNIPRANRFFSITIRTSQNIIIITRRDKVPKGLIELETRASLMF